METQKEEERRKGLPEREWPREQTSVFPLVTRLCSKRSDGDEDPSSVASGQEDEEAIRCPHLSSSREWSLYLLWPSTQMPHSPPPTLSMCSVTRHNPPEPASDARLTSRPLLQWAKGHLLLSVIKWRA